MQTRFHWFHLVFVIFWYPPDEHSCPLGFFNNVWLYSGWIVWTWCQFHVSLRKLLVARQRASGDEGDSRFLCLGQNAALEHNTKTIADCTVAQNIMYVYRVDPLDGSQWTQWTVRLTPRTSVGSSSSPRLSSSAYTSSSSSSSLLLPFSLCHPSPLSR